VVFDATFITTAPLPEPLAPEVMLTQLAPEETDHAHPAGAVTARVAGPPVAGAEIVVGDTE
jgi:hypothetical protein